MLRDWKLIRLLIVALAIWGGFASQSQAQFGQAPGTVGGASNFNMPILLPFPGMMWVEGQFVENGLGFEGRYFTVGGMAYVYTDKMNGSYFVDARGHVSERGNFFGNIGFGRSSFFAPLSANLSMSGWYDYDADQAEFFGHTFRQVGGSLDLVSEVSDWEARVNGYFPIGESDHRFGSPETCFAQNNLLLVHGFDTALRGVDGEFGKLIPILDLVDGHALVGGYYYDGSNAVESFGGVRVRLELRLPRGPVVNMQLNHDDQFNTTGLITAAFRLNGVSGGRQIEPKLPVQRNDHIVRVHRDPVFLTNTTTLLPWRVVHVDNTNPNPGSGTFEDPFNSLKLAEAGSLPNDIIFVNRGDGTTTNYNQGIILKNDQLLFGDGVQHVIQTVQIPNYVLCNTGLVKPVITNPLGPAVTLANRNRVAGFTMQSAQYGVMGNSTAGHTIIRENMILNSAIHGIAVQDVTGPYTVIDNMIDGSGGNGVNVANSNITLNVASTSAAGLASITNSSGRGVNVVDSAGTYNVLGVTFMGNGSHAVNVENSTGTATVSQSVITNNGGAGVRANINQNALTVNVNNNRLNSNMYGVMLGSSGANTVLTASIMDNPEINTNTASGVRVDATTGSTLMATIGNGSISGNGTTAGVGLDMRNNSANLDVSVTNVSFLNNLGMADPTNMANDVNSIFGLTQGTGDTRVVLTNLMIDESLVTGNGGDAAVRFEFDTPLPPNMSSSDIEIDNVSIVNAAGGGLRVLTRSDSRAIVNVRNGSSITGSLGGGISLDALDTSRISFTLDGSNVSDGMNHGITVETFDTARIIATITNNTINRNGTLVNHEGISLGGFGNGANVIVADIFSNQIVGTVASNGMGVVQTDSNSMVFALLRTNTIANSGGGAIPDVVANFQAGAMNANICLELTSNTTQVGTVLTPLAGNTLQYEDNPVNGNGTIVPNGATLVPQGTCQTASNPFRTFP